MSRRNENGISMNRAFAKLLSDGSEVERLKAEKDKAERLGAELAAERYNILHHACTRLNAGRDKFISWNVNTGNEVDMDILESILFDVCDQTYPVDTQKSMVEHRQKVSHRQTIYIEALEGILDSVRAERDELKDRVEVLVNAIEGSSASALITQGIIHDLILERDSLRAKLHPTTAGGR